MAEYRISGIWTDAKGVITHYALHQRFKTENGHAINQAVKTSKADAIKLVEDKAITVKTYIWNYKLRRWQAGEDVHVAGSGNSKYLRSNHDNTVQDNLLHLIDYSYIYE